MTMHDSRLNGNGAQAGEAARVACYYRVSSPEQLKKFGYDRQRRELPEFAAKMGWQVVAEYEEPGISAETLFRRPALMRLLEEARRGSFGMVLAVEDDRFSRGDLADWQYIKNVCDEHEIGLATLHGVIYRPNDDDDDFLTDIRGSVTKRERKKNARRMAACRREAVKQGGLPHGECPYGYTMERRGRRGSDKDLVENPEQAEVVRLIFRLVADGLEGKPMGAARLVCHLSDELQIPAPGGGRWYTRSLSRMIRNPIYRGEWYYGRTAPVEPKRRRSPDSTRKTLRERPREEWQTIEVPAILTPELWQAANDAMDHRLKHARGRPAEKNPPGLLASYLRCPHCGYAVFHVQEPRVGGRVARNYVCGGRMFWRRLGIEKCENPRWPAETVEAAVWEEVARLVKSPDLLRETIEAAAEEPTPDTTAQQMAEVQRKMAANDNAIAKVKAAYREDTYTLEELQAELAIIRREREGLEERLTRLCGQIAAREEWEEAVTSAIDLCESYREAVEHADPEDKRQIIEELVREVTLDAEGNYRVEFYIDRARSGRVPSELRQASQSRSIC